MSDREMIEFDARMELVLAAEQAEAVPPPASVRLADLVPEDVVIAPTDCDLANHAGYEEMPE